MSTHVADKHASPSRRATINEPIAITGVGCRFPGGVDSPEALWDLLCRGQDAIREVPSDRWDVDRFYDDDPDKQGKTYARWGGFVDRIDRFDAQFFGISPREAVHVDPQQRLLLEVAWEAIEDAGEVVDRLSGSDTGVFIGISSHDYADLQVKGCSPSGTGLYATTGVASSIAANRLSYVFNFQGPSFAVDTACSSSLVAVHLACQSIWREEVRLALAGGVNCLITPEPTISFSKASMLSPDGRCKAFDASANGYVRSEGAGLVILKPLRTAQRDGDRIYALIRATALNQDGRTQGLTLPNRSSQEALLRSVYRQAGIEGRQVSYIEAHGTGTAAGDPIEANAIGTVLGRDRPSESRLWIGSVKTNIGHLEAASGMAGLIKTALILERRRIPPNLHFETPNPRIDFDALKIAVPTAIESLSPSAGQAIAGVNSFGFGGANAHVVLSEVPPDPQTPPASESAPARAHLLPLSARTPQALRAVVERWADFLSVEPGPRSSLRDLCYTASVRRSHHDHRLSLAFRSRDDARDQLDAFLHDEGRPGMASGRVVPGRRRKVAFVFSGMGPQWWGMGRRLIEQEPVFRESIERCDRLLRQYATWSLTDELYRDEGSSRMGRTEIAQPAIFALQVGLSALWRSWGVEPDVIVGHSAGEVAAACAAGALGLEEAVQVIFHRSRLQQLASGQGSMLAIGASLDEAQRRIAPYEPRVSIAAINSAHSITLSGDTDALQTIAADIDRDNGFARLLTVDVPYHSHHMAPLRKELIRCLESIAPQTSAVPIFSTVTGTIADRQAFDAAYWWENVNRPVLFAEAITRLAADGYDTFVEIAPHPALARPIIENLLQTNAKGVVVPSLRREEDDLTVLLGSLGTLYTQGHPVDWRKLYPEPGCATRLPSYPWQREDYWTEPHASRQYRIGHRPHPLLGRRIETAHATWETDLDAHDLRYLLDHRVQDSPVYPAAGYVEVALAVGREVFQGDPFSVERLELLKPLVLREAGTVLQSVFDPEESLLEIHARGTSDGPWTLYATATLARATDAPVRRVDLEDIRRACANEIDRLDCYRDFATRGLHYGPAFQGIRVLRTGGATALGLIRLPETLNGSGPAYALHPAILDACFQVLVGVASNERGSSEGIHLPVRIGRVRLRRACPSGAELWSAVTVVRQSPGTIDADYEIFDEAGNLLADVKGFQCQLLPTARPLALQDLADCLWDAEWFAKSHAGAVHDAPAFLKTPTEIAALANPEIAALCEKRDRRRHYAEVIPQVDALCFAYVYEAFQQLGWSLEAGRPVSTDALADRLDVAPAYRRSFERMLDMAAEEGVLEKTSDGWNVRRAGFQTQSAVLRDAFSRAYPEYEPEIDLLSRSGESLAEVLRGKQDPLQLLFPNGSLAPAERFYQESPNQSFYQIVIQRVVSRAIESLPADRALRILEIGAGTGATTAHVISVIPPSRTEYVFSDVSTVFTAAASRKFADAPFIDYRILDIERAPLEQGFDEHSFDVIIATDVLHATRDLRLTLSNVRRLLASEGLLILLEIPGSNRFLDLVFGLQSGWWRFADHDLRPDGPCLTHEGWRDLLLECGFSDITALSDWIPGHQPNQCVMLGRAARLDVPRQAACADPGESGNWLIFADRGGTGAALARRLRSLGQEVVSVSQGKSFRQIDSGHLEIDPNRSSDVQALIDWIETTENRCRGILHLWTLDGPPTDSLEPADLDRYETLGCIAGMYLVQALVRADWSEPPRLFFVTRGAQSVGPATDVGSLTGASLWGFGRVLVNEHQQLRCTLVDLAPSGTPDDADQLLQEVLSNGPEREVAFRGQTRYVSRVINLPPKTLENPDSGRRLSASETPFRLEVSRPGMLDSMVLRESTRRAPEAGEVEIEIHAASLNFRDVMRAMGMLPQGVDENGYYGGECSGRITRVGPGVEHFTPGEEIVGLTGESFASHTIARACDLLRKPACLDFVQAASIPSPFLTASYALDYLARLGRGERVLIHSAAGGVGLAAVQLAQRAGARIFATAGNDEKREVLRSLGVEWVGDSRSVDFADEIARVTGGEGVDVVLNSLAGEFIPKSLLLLRPGGRFLEIGKVDIYRNARMGLLPFRKALSYFAIDLIQLHRDRQAFVMSLLSDILREFERGALQPSPITTFPASAMADAFRHMAQAKHIGKIIVTVQDQNAAVVPREIPLFRPDASYLVTGGLGGFGLTVAQWMIANGARHLILAGRSGASRPETQRAIESMTRAGAQVLACRLDVADAEQVESLIGNIRNTMPPLRGVLHAAMVLDDGVLLQLDAARFRRVTAPKIHGAWNLHVATAGCPLDFFVLFSSVTAVIGGPGQANYAAANTFMDSLAHFRRSRNLPALSVNFGSLADVGYVARHADVGRHLESLGLRSFKAREATSILGHLLRASRPQAAATRINPEDASVPLPQFETPRMRYMARRGEQSHTSGQRNDSVRHALGRASAAERQAVVETFVREHLARILGTSPGRLELDRPLVQLGIDSLMAVELETIFESQLGIPLPMGLLLGSDVTAVQLVTRFLDQLSELDPGSAAAAPTPAVSMSPAADMAGV